MKYSSFEYKLSLEEAENAIEQEFKKYRKNPTIFLGKRRRSFHIVHTYLKYYSNSMSYLPENRTSVKFGISPKQVLNHVKSLQGCLIKQNLSSAELPWSERDTKKENQILQKLTKLLASAIYKGNTSEQQRLLKSVKNLTIRKSK